MSQSKGKTMAKKLQVTQCWSTQEEIDELRGKYHLKSKDAEAYRESAKLQMRQNYGVIAHMRRENRQTHLEVADGENFDVRVIKNALKNERETRLSLQRFSSEDAVIEMDHRVSGSAKFLNAFTYERERREKKFEDLKQELERLEFCEQKSAGQLETEQSVTNLENSLDKAMIKSDTAKMITERYVKILEKLQQESATLPAKLEAMEGALIDQKLELKRLKKMSEDALSSRDTAKKELQQVEINAWESKKKRDAELAATRKDVERRKGDYERGDKRATRAALLHEGTDQKSSAHIQHKRANQRKILTLEEGFARIKEACHVTDLDEAVERVKNQKGTHGKLRTRVSELESLRNRLREEKQKLNSQFHDMKFSGEQKLSRGQRLLEQMQENMEKEITRKERILGRLERNGSALIKVKTGISTLLEKLNEIKLKPPLFNYTQGGVFDQLELSTNKIDQLVRDLAEHGPEEQQLVANDQIQSNDFQEYLEGLLTPDNLRVKVESSESQSSVFDFDGHENEVLSRNDIKKMGQNFAESRQKPKSKKKSKKKKN